MAEPQPPSVHEGAAEPHAPTSTAEDRKAAAALSTLDAQEDTSEKKEVDTKALDKAMKGLGVQDKKGEESVKKVVKVEAADVNLLVGLVAVERVMLGELGTRLTCTGCGT
tara:strand:- start:1351 stop:1680 length:330 start_codon:yes stop_codon:yes gene_type:complete